MKCYTVSPIKDTKCSSSYGINIDFENEIKKAIIKVKEEYKKYSKRLINGEPIHKTIYK